MTVPTVCRPLARFAGAAAALAASTAFAAAQHTILMASGTSDERTLAIDAPEIDLIRNDEIYAVTPVPGGGYSQPFRK